jgi:hypothetical protein
MTAAPPFGCRHIDLPAVVVMRCGDVGMYLADVGGFATHVGSCDDLEPGVPSLHAAVILDEVHALLSLHTRMPALEQDVHLMMQAGKRSGNPEEDKEEQEKGGEEEKKQKVWNNRTGQLFPWLVK